MDEWAVVWMVGLLTLLGLGLLTLLTLLGFIRAAELLQQWITGRGRHDRRDRAVDADERVALAARALAVFGADVQWSAGRLLATIAQHPQPKRAAEAALADLRFDGGAGVPQTRPSADTDEADASRRAVRVSGGAPRTASTSTAGVATIVARWLDLDNITLLLYVGATLVVIAAGVFVGSSWDAIGAMARFGVIAFAAAAFLVVGVAMTQADVRLRRAGETFRGVGMVLMPFVGLAYDRFVLDGAASPPYWLSLAVLLAVVYYAMHRWVSPGRLTSYLAAISGAVTALLLPDVLGLSNDWEPTFLLAAAAALFAVALAAEPRRDDLWRRAAAFRLEALSESHLIVALVVGALSAALLVMEADVIRPTPATLTYLIALTLGMAVAARVSGSAGAACAAVLAAALSIHQAAHWSTDDPRAIAVALVLSWTALSWLVIWAWPRWGQARSAGAALPDFIALLPAAAASVYALAWLSDTSYGDVVGLAAVATASAAALIAVLARRHDLPALLFASAVLLHIAVLDGLRLAPGRGDPHLVTSIIWLLLAGIWLLAARRRWPEWASRAWTGLFVAEACWVSVYALAGSEALVPTLVGTVLTAMWWLWWRWTRHPAGVAALAAQAVYATFALWLWIELPATFLPAALLAIAAVGIAAHGRVATDTRGILEATNLLLLLAAPFGGYLVAGMGAPVLTIGALGIAQAGQIALLLTVLTLLWRGREAGNRIWLAAGASQAFVLYVWLAHTAGVSQAQLYTVPFGILLLVLAWLFGESREILEGCAAAAILLPAGLQAGIEDTLGFTLLLGLWGLVLWAAGLTFERRVLVATGIAGLLLAALRQLWEIAARLPPGVVVGIVGVMLMSLAVVLMWRRDLVVDIGRKGGAFRRRTH